MSKFAMQICSLRFFIGGATACAIRGATEMDSFSAQDNLDSRLPGAAPSRPPDIACVFNAQAFAARYTSFDGFPAYRCLFLDVRRVVHRRRPLPPRRQHRPLRRLRPRLRRTTHVARAKCAAVGLEMWYVDAVSFAAFVRRNESSRRASGSSPGEPLHLKHSGPRPARSGANNLRKPNASRFTSSCRAIRPS
jgi:hypothetical protein